MNFKYYIYIKTQTKKYTICAISIDKLNSFIDDYNCGNNPMINGKIYF